MKIGLDFDGVITDAGDLKSYGAKLLYGIDIPPERFKKRLIVGTEMTAEQYDRLSKTIYYDREVGMRMRPVDGMLEYLPKLLEEGYDVRIVTSRDGAAADIARAWLREQGLGVELIGNGKGSKAIPCTGRDIFVDDDLPKLEELIGTVPNLYLFSWGYNTQEETHSGISRIESWKQIYRRIKEAT